MFRLEGLVRDKSAITLLLAIRLVIPEVSMKRSRPDASSWRQRRAAKLTCGGFECRTD
jgi:hypothetical protein